MMKKPTLPPIKPPDTIRPAGLFSLFAMIPSGMRTMPTASDVSGGIFGGRVRIEWKNARMILAL